jgi:hypothetical protein
MTTTNTTTRDLINGAGRLINIIQQNEAMTGDNLNIALYSLNHMIDSWSNNRLMIYSIKQFEFPLTGQQTYTLGPGGDWDVPRPMKIETAYARLQPGSPQQLDIAMQPLTVQQYASIAVKKTPSTFPFAYYDNNNYPLRDITLFPIPSGPANIVLWLREPLIDLDDIDAEVMYPPGYERAFRFNLAVELAAEFGKTCSPEVIARANNSINELQRLNSVPMYLRGDGGMSRSGRNRYFNWITGNFWSFGNN